MPIYNQIGCTPANESTEWLRALLPPNILLTVCHYSYQECVDTAHNLYHNGDLNLTMNSIPVDLRLTVYCTITRTGSRSEFHFLCSRLQTESVLSEALNMLEELSCTQNSLAIRRQDLLSSIARIARSPGANQIMWNWIGDNCLKLLSKWEIGTLNKIIEAVSSRFPHCSTAR